MSAVVYNVDDPTKELPTVAPQNAVTEDFLIWSQSGLYCRVDVPGSGTVLIEAGRVILDAIDASPATPHKVLWQAGNHQVWDGEIGDLCEALSKRERLPAGNGGRKRMGTGRVTGSLRAVCPLVS